MGNRVTQEEIIKRFRSIHGDKYDYSKVVFSRTIDKVKIICPEHGEFEQIAREHFKGNNCPKCARENNRKIILDIKNAKIPPEDIIIPVNAKAINLSRGKWAIVDEDKYESLIKYCWYASKTANTYAVGGQRDISQKPILMHRYILGLGPSDKVYVDHKNGDGLDNRLCNLRICTQRQNSMNASPSKSSRSKYKGIYLDTRYNKWRAEIVNNGKKIILPLSTYTEEEAARAYDAAAIKYFGEFAWLNFPEEHGFPPREKEL